MKILKITALALSLVLILSLISCGGKKDSKKEGKTETKAAVTEKSDETAETDEALTEDIPTDTAEVPADTAAPADTDAAEVTDAPETRQPYVYSPDDELFSTPPVLGDIWGIWHVVSSKGDFIKITLETGDWSYFTCENGEFKTLHSGMIVKGDDGYIYAEGDGERRKIYWEDTHPCFEGYGQLTECTENELIEALDNSIG